MTKSTENLERFAFTRKEGRTYKTSDMGFLLIGRGLLP